MVNRYNADFFSSIYFKNIVLLSETFILLYYEVCYIYIDAIHMTVRVQVV